MKVLTAIRSTVQRALAAVRATFDLRDMFVFGGLGCVAIGTAQIYTPAAWIVVGVALFWIGVKR